MMNADPVLSRIWEVVGPVAAGEGMEVVDIEFRREGGRGGRLLRVFIDKAGGPTVDDLTRVSRRLGEVLDEGVEFDGPYTLEVSSPGINRALKNVEHFARFVGKRIRVRTRETIDGRKAFLGPLKEVQADGIAMLQDGVEVRIGFASIEKANYEHDWGK
jgi:ribosome maturation factor RimP